ncbi:hypothetical protein [Nostoc sp. PCC 7107]|uniref:hypothetical protein n=1 Tax=Nostoc sp. PCC 7107 TaxID=317936 RepID=UPI00029F43D2|nr:hypothetical protein [Nostoc sp. PCC 7107]AFY42009.1 hypothetical protein Nos7107_1362 [Nostoc sp. PCC 7107]
MKLPLKISTVVASLTILAFPANAEASQSVMKNMRFFITSENLLIAANIQSGSACSLNQGISVTKMSGFKTIEKGNSNVRVSGKVESFLSIKNNEISPVSGKFQSNARVRTADWLIRNTQYYPEFLSAMTDCTREGGLKRMQLDAPSP